MLMSPKVHVHVCIDLMHTLQLETGHQSQSGYYEDFCDGEVFKSHPLYSLHCDGLQLFLYFDEVEICNPLGSKRKKHKLGKLIAYMSSKCLTFTRTSFLIIGFFYFTLGNLMPRYRSSLSAIQLLGIVKRSIMIEYGMNAILQPFVNDIKKLVYEITLCILSTSLGGLLLRGIAFEGDHSWHDNSLSILC